MSCLPGECGLVCHKPQRNLSTKRKQADVTDSTTALHPFFTTQIRAPIAAAAEKPLDDIATAETTTTMETTSTSEPLTKKKKRSNEKKFQCKYSGCVKSFKYPNELLQHDNWAHLGIRSYVCGYIDELDGSKCEHACERPGCLQRHKQAQHTREKPFECPDCAEAFIQSGLRRRHYLLHHAPADHPDLINLLAKSKAFKCTDCELTFGAPKKRDDHYIRHHHDPLKDNPALVAIQLKKSAHHQKRLAEEPLYGIRRRVRDGLRRLLDTMGLTKNSYSKDVVGCTFEEVMAHLNNNDRGLVYRGDSAVVLHIDHIRPLASFNLGCRVELLKAANFNNLQLLPGSENISKKDRFTPLDAAAYADSVGGKAIAELEKGWRAAGVCDCEECVQ